jgi:hypothetical protein
MCAMNRFVCPICKEQFDCLPIQGRAGLWRMPDHPPKDAPEPGPGDRVEYCAGSDIHVSMRNAVQKAAE